MLVHILMAMQERRFRSVHRALVELMHNPLECRCVRVRRPVHSREWPRGPVASPIVWRGRIRLEVPSLAHRVVRALRMAHRAQWIVPNALHAMLDFTLELEQQIVVRFPPDIPLRVE